MVNQDFTFDQERLIAQYFNSHSIKADLTTENLLEDYLTFEPDQKQRKQLEEIYKQAECHQKIAIAMGEYDSQRGLKPDRRLAANEWYRLGFNKAYWQSILALYGIEPNEFNN